MIHWFTLSNAYRDTCLIMRMQQEYEVIRARLYIHSRLIILDIIILRRILTHLDVLIRQLIFVLKANKAFFFFAGLKQHFAKPKCSLSLWRINLCFYLSEARYSELYCASGVETYIYIGLNGKFLRFSNEKSIIFFKIYIQYLINYIISIAWYYRPPCHKLFNSGLVKTSWLRNLFENAKTFRSTQYIMSSALCASTSRPHTYTWCVLDSVLVLLLYIHSVLWILWVYFSFSRIYIMLWIVWVFFSLHNACWFCTSVFHTHVFAWCVVDSVRFNFYSYALQPRVWELCIFPCVTDVHPRCSF
jgi:hypothetical protein